MDSYGLMPTFTQNIIDKLVARDEQTFNRFYLQTVDIFSRYLRSHYQLSHDEYDDIISDFYVKMWQSLSSYKSGGSFDSYVWTILRNHTHDYIRKHHDIYFTDMNHYWEDGVERQETLSNNEDILSELEISYQEQMIQDAMKELDPQTRDILHLKFTQDCSYEYIANILGMQQELVRQKVSRGIKKLKQLLK